MDNVVLENLVELYENQECKNCIFTKTCDFLLDNHKNDICRTILNEYLKGEN